MSEPPSYTAVQQDEKCGDPSQGPPPGAYYPPQGQPGYPPPGQYPPQGQPGYPPPGQYPPGAGQSPQPGQPGVYYPGATGPPPSQPGYYPPGGAIPLQPMKGQEGAGGPANVVYAQDEVAQINDYMIANILACLCCCWCIGCFAIMKSNECQKAKQQRDLEAAKRFSESAKNLLIATVVVGAIFVAISVGIQVYLTMSRASYAYP